MVLCSTPDGKTFKRKGVYFNHKEVLAVGAQSDGSHSIYSQKAASDKGTEVNAQLAVSFPCSLGPHSRMWCHELSSRLTSLIYLVSHRWGQRFAYRIIVDTLNLTISIYNHKSTPRQLDTLTCI